MFGLPIGMLLVGWAPLLLTGCGAFYLGLRLVRALERRSAASADLAAQQEHLLRLEESVAVIAAQIERLSDGQEFATKLLGDRK